MQTYTSRFKGPMSSGFLAGLIAGVIASGVMLLLNAVADGLSLPQEFGAKLASLMSPQTFTFLHQLIGDNAKYYFFIIVFIGQCLVFALAGGLYNVLSARQVGRSADQPLQWNDGLTLALLLWLFAGLLLLPLTGSGVFGADLTAGLISGMLSLAVIGLIFGLLFVFCQRWLLTLRRSGTVTDSEDDAETAQLSRRRLLKQGGITVGVAVVGFGLWHFISQGIGAAKVPVTRLLQGYTSKVSPVPTPNYGALQPVQYLSPEITSNDQYYVVSKNLTDPTVSADGWSLKVDGLVDHPFSLSYQELLALPMKQQYESMECISNEVGGSYMSSALWEGVPMASLLQRAGYKDGVSKVVMHGYDDYTDTIQLSKALEPTTLIAVRMNGKPLPDGHGFPARVLVPGIYGMKHVKWLTHIELVNTDVMGYWQQAGWSDPAPIRLTSRIDAPLDGSHLTAHQQAYIAGVAFSGNKGISEVDVSVDAGATWQRALLKQPLSGLTWVLWELTWQPAAPGKYTVLVRAIDLEGNVQDPHEASPAPDGSSGYHSITVNVQ